MKREKPRKAAKPGPAYPKPKEAGGRLIRAVIGLLRVHEITLPIDSHILVGASAGVDSTALAVLLARYGRRVVGDPRRLELLHVNHGWRGEESEADERHVQALGRKLGLKVRTRRITQGKDGKGESAEDRARKARKEIFKSEARAESSVILTAHHADDLAETLLWRLFTGAGETHGGGIAVKTGREIRPLLGVRKDLLKEFLREEGVAWREDASNSEERYLRAKMRKRLMPEVERQFPRAVERLVEAALGAQTQKTQPEASPGPELLIRAAGLHLRRPHWEALERKLRDDPGFRGELHLPGGWILRRQRHGEPRRWIWTLEEPETKRPSKPAT